MSIEKIMPKHSKIIVLDDDPMGSQTVHGCLLLTNWDVPTLLVGLQDEVNIFFVISNTRALSSDEASNRIQEICQNLRIALDQAGINNFLLVSRSDSTLRGHYPIETDAIISVFGAFDAHFLMPAFFDAGRFTKNSIHYLSLNGRSIPVHETEFAKDSVFSYHHSFLPDYIEEKTNGRILATEVKQFTLNQVRQGSVEQLMRLVDHQCCVVDGEEQSDFNIFTADIITAINQGKRFLFSSAASLLTSLASLGPQTIQPEEMYVLAQNRPGIIVVGSHVGQTTIQLEELLKTNGLDGVEVPVERLLLEDSDCLVGEAIAKVKVILQSGKTAVVYTSREEQHFLDVEMRQRFGLKVASTLTAIINQLPTEIGFLISKGGITSNAILNDVLQLPTVRLLGQIYPGCSVLQTPNDHPHYPGLPIVLFPGNVGVGDQDALKTIYQRLISKP